MPTNENKPFDRGCVYRLHSPLSDSYYYGSTVRSIKKRLTHHMYMSRTSNRPLYQWVRRMGKGNVRIEVLNEKQQTTRKELRMLEDNLIRDHKDDPNCLNCHRAFLSEQDLKAAQRAYEEKNKEHLREYRKQWREDNRDALLEKKRQYHREHKDDISAYRDAPIECPNCGQTTTRRHISTHRKSAKCKRLSDAKTI